MFSFTIYAYLLNKRQKRAQDQCSFHSPGRLGAVFKGTEIANFVLGKFAKNESVTLHLRTQHYEHYIISSSLTNLWVWLSVRELSLSFS